MKKQPTPTNYLVRIAGSNASFISITANSAPEAAEKFIQNSYPVTTYEEYTVEVKNSKYPGYIIYKVMNHFTHEYKAKMLASVCTDLVDVKISDKTEISVH